MAKTPTTDTKPAGDTAEQLSADLKKVQGELDKANADLAVRDATIKDLEGKLEAAKSEISEKTTDLEKANDERAKAEAELQALQPGGTPAVKTGGLRITAKPKGGFRRAGVHHPSGPVNHEPGTFDDKQIAQLRDDPNLVVVDI
ncbi:MAG: hypothetical protein KDJ90_12715 [Nitratireductor sp.]|nr:hypothetical protein [Nitratireductor sp.]